MANTDVNDFLQDIDNQITFKTNQIYNIEKNLSHITKSNKKSGYVITGVGLIVITWCFYCIWSYHYSDDVGSIYLPIILTLIFAGAPVAWNYITNRISKKIRYNLKTLNDELSELQSLRERKIKAYSQLQQILLIISSVESNVKKFDDNLLNIYDSFNEWLNNIRIIQNGNHDDDNNIGDILLEAKKLANSIFDGDSHSSLYDKFMKYQISLLHKIESNFAQSVYDELQNSAHKNNFVERVVNIKAPIELNNRFASERMVFLGDISMLSPNNQGLPSVIETDHPNTIVHYNNPLIILGLIEKGFSIDDIKDISF